MWDRSITTEDVPKKINVINIVKYIVTNSDQIHYFKKKNIDKNMHKNIDVNNDIIIVLNNAPTTLINTLQKPDSLSCGIV